MRWIVFVAGLVGAAAVGVGAFAAHGLEAKLLADGLSADQVAKKLATCDVAVRYHLTHAVALLDLSAAPAAWSPKRRTLAAVLFLLGLGMFCGVLYAQAIGGLVGFNLVVPVGGLCFILGWLAVALLAFSRPLREN
jgi:uncharacterized membrane protein YgdD (TMEM256/DUF423 family)